MMNEYDDDFADPEDDGPPEKSKTQIKREHLALQDLARELVELPDRQLRKVDLSDPVRAEIVLARRLKMGAHKRQVKHIGKLLQDEEPDRIRATLAELKVPNARAVQRLHELEGWRDGLLRGDEGVMEALLADYPDFDRQHVRQLVRNALKEQAQNKPPKSARALYQYLAALETPGAMEEPDDDLEMEDED